MWVSLLIGFLFSIYSGNCRPNGAPQTSCFYMTPRHIHPHTMRRVFPTQANGLYNITTSSDVFRPDRPLRVTLWGPPFKGFMLVAAEEGAKDWPAGVFYSDDGSAERMNCLGHGDTATHVNNSYKDSVSLLWYGPDNMAVEQVQFIATVVVNMTIYYTNIRSGWIRVDPTLQAARQGDGGTIGVTVDPWLLGQDQNPSDPWSSGRGGLLGGNLLGGTGTGSSWGSRSGNGGGTFGSGSGTGNLWGDTSSWGNSGGGSANSWDWNNPSGRSSQGSSSGSGSGWGRSGSNWNWGRTTTGSWRSNQGGWGATTTESPQTTRPLHPVDTQQQSGTGTGSDSASNTGGSGTDTKQSSIDWIKNIPTQTWYDILQRLGFGISNPVSDANTGSASNSGSTGSQAARKK